METTTPELPSILRLLDDENPTVREAVKRKLASYGNELSLAIEREAPGTSFTLREQARELQREHERDEFLSAWKAWAAKPDIPTKLEEGQVLLSTYLNAAAGEEAPDIPDSLDRLAAGFREEFALSDFRNLATYLFTVEKFRGDVERYYHPDNSNLARVLERKKGNPITLACVYMLVGQRLGLNVGGCNYPAHFLARAVSEHDGRLFLIDCFNEGKVIPAEDLIRHHPLASYEVQEVVESAATAEVILSRSLRNLENAFAQNNLPPEQAFMRRLRQTMAAGDQA